MSDGGGAGAIASSGIIAATLARAETYLALSTGRSASRRRLRKPVSRAMIVCYGNIYRSAFLGAWLAQRCAGRCEVRSSGLHANTGRPCPDRLLAQARARGLALDAHRSARLSQADLGWADLFVVMDRHNYHALRRLGVPRAKIAWAGAFTRGPLEIADPYDGDDAALARTVERLVESGDQIAAALGSTN
ncbi:MAG: hypothetical protein OEW98_09655 [Betaproteobacteria bacterium]|nr:hypothetical protein [Betaproteobacteria bacterium]